jgi:site-specific DNA recombinase
MAVNASQTIARRQPGDTLTAGRKISAPAVTRAVLYVRVSSEEQVEGYSIDGQKAHLVGFAQGLGYVVTDAYVDAGISGKDIDHRPALLRLLADARAGKFDVVLVWKTNRLSRRLKDLLVILEALDDAGVAFRSATEPQNETATPAGKLMMQMLGAIGEFERNTIIDNVKMGMRQRSRQGHWSGSEPLGYRWADGPDGRGRVLEVVPEKAAVVRTIFKLYAGGKGLKAVANALNHAGHRTKRGCCFSSLSVSHIIHNPSYLGLVREAGAGESRRRRPTDVPDVDALIAGRHEPLIDRRTWDRVHVLYDSRKGKADVVWDRRFPLTGLMRCPECGAGMTMARTTNRLRDGRKRVLHYYACGRWKSQGTAACHSNMVRADVAEEVVTGRLRAVATDPGLLEATVTHANAHRRDVAVPLRARLEEVRRQVAEMRAARDRYLRDYERGRMASAAMEARVTELDLEIAMREADAHGLEAALARENEEQVDARTVGRALGLLLWRIETGDDEQQKALLHLVIEEIAVSENAEGRRQVGAIHLRFSDAVIRVLGDGAPANRRATRCANKAPSFRLTI